MTSIWHGILDFYVSKPKTADYIQTAWATTTAQQFGGDFKRKKREEKLLPHLSCLSPKRRAGNLEKLPRFHPATGSQKAQTTCRERLNTYGKNCRLSLRHTAGSNSRRILRHSALEERQIFAVLVVKPLDLEVQVHVIGTLAQAIFLMFWEKKNRLWIKISVSPRCLLASKPCILCTTVA